MGLGAVAVFVGVAVVLLVVLGAREPVKVLQVPQSPGPSRGTPAVTAAATPSPSPSATVTPGTVTTLQVGTQGIIGYDTTVYYTAGCVRCGRSPVPELYRLRRDPSGRLERDDLFPFRSRYPDGYVHSFAAEWERGHFVAAVCVRGYCGGEGDPTTTEPLQLLETSDGGITWAEAGTLPVNSWLIGFIADRTMLDAAVDGPLLVAEYSGSEPRYSLWPSGEAVTPPRVGEDLEPAAVAGRGLFWVSRPKSGGEGAYFDAVGHEVLRVPGVPTALVGAVKHGGWIVQWIGDDGSYVGHYEDAMQWAYRWTTDIFRIEGIIPPLVETSSGRVTPLQLYGNVLLEDFYCFGVSRSDCNNTDRMFPLYPALIDVISGQVHPIAQIVDEYPEFTGNHNPFVLNIDPNPRARVVAGADDCLNVRAQPSAAAPVLECVPDAVLLLKRSDAPVPADGVTWLPVWTPAFEQGWASAEFLR